MKDRGFTLRRAEEGDLDRWVALAAIEWARQSGDHKIVLQVWPHNARAQALYRKSGFVEKGRLQRQYRRRNGELWDAIAMGLILDTTSPGSSFDALRTVPDKG